MRIDRLPPRAAVDNLRLHPEVVKGLAAPWDEIAALASLITVIEPSLPDFLKSQDIQKGYGLFGNDAINALLVKKASIKYIATADRDFDRLDFAQRIEVEAE